MTAIPQEIIRFFEKQSFTIVSTVDKNGMPHSSCKGVVEMDKSGKVYLLDLYKKKTFNNLKTDRNISVTAVDEHKFSGWCLKGKAKIVASEKLGKEALKAWEGKITSRISQRVIKNIRGEKGHPRHPEVLLPKPEYMIVMEVREIVDLAPHHLKAKE